MTSSRTRLAVLSGAFLAALAIVLLHLWSLMVVEQDVWARRSYENRWAFRSVPSQRGRLLDRDGDLLAWDEPTTRASIYYRRFRVYHVIGAAVHGATHWASLQPHRAGTTYTIEDGVLGPRIAAEDLLSVPVRALQPGALSKSEFSPLVTYATTVLSVCSGMARKKVYAAMRKAAVAGANVGIGDVLSMPRAELLQRFDERLQSLHELNALFVVEQESYNLRLGRTKVDPTLLQMLERLRRYSLEKRKVVIDVERDENGKEISRRLGSLIEDMRRYFAQDVDFELAAALRVNRKAHPGIGVEPSIRRVRRGGRDTSLGVMIGEVRSNDRLIWETRDASGNIVRHRQPSMLDESRDELVPYDVVGDEATVEHMRKEAERRYERETLVNERSGISGLEALCDDDLTGKLGMRFVEHDSRRREHRLWSHLRVESGKDAHMTIDVQLQELAELAVRESDARYRGGYSKPRDLNGLESALAIIDAHTGDILALAGAPVRSDPNDIGSSTLRVPGLIWLSNGSIGSVVKPFILLEHLESQRLGRPYQSAETMKPCAGSIVLHGRRLKCDHNHWDEGRNPIPALAKSCNVFFYQAGDGLEADGIGRALRRFGLTRPRTGDPFFECWQPRVRGLPIAEPFVDSNISMLRRAIGYGVQAPPLYIARAYAGIATGVLPDVGLRIGEPRRFIPLGDIGESLAVVREGMADCVLIGTADEVPLRESWEVHAKTGTAEINSVTEQNNGWFAGFMPWTGQGGMQIVFCAVVYRVPAGVHGGKAAGGLVANFLQQVERDPELNQRYLTK